VHGMRRALTSCIDSIMSRINQELPVKLSKQDLQFKQNLESITFDDIQEIRERKAKHAIDLDSLEIDLKTADTYVEIMQEFLEALNFSNDRIENVECRRRDGFIPHSWNNGGLEGVAYRDQYSACENTGFENTDVVLGKYYDYFLKDWMEENKHPSTDSMNDVDWENFDEYRRESDDTIQFQARIVMTSETTANVDFYISASDSPYHRQSDDKLEIEIEFKTPAGMKRKLNSILKRAFVQKFKQNVREAF
jgi:hypothetical protein